MLKDNASCTALRCGTSIILSIFCGVVTASAQESALQFDEIIVTGQRAVEDLTRIAPDAESLLSTPGDVNDPLKALLSLPGITFGGGDLDDPIIRGGGPRDNLFIIDGVPVETVFHELSDSIVSPNVIRTFDLNAAAFSPEYGDATGGVINIGLRDPSATERQVNVDLSQLKSGIHIETPLTDSIAVYGAYRHNLAHLFLKEFERGNDALVFQMPESRDYTGRAIWRGDNTDITLSAFGSWDKTEEVARDDALTDVLGEEETRQLDAQSVRLRTSISEATKVIATLSHSKINEVRQEASGFAEPDATIEASGSFAERDATVLAFRGKVSHQAGRHAIEMGLNHTHADNELRVLGFIPLCDLLEENCGGAFSSEPVTIEKTFQSTEVFLSDRIEVTDRLTVDLGVHGAVNHHLDETFVEPRLGVVYAANDDLDIYARFGRHHNSPDANRLLILNMLSELQESESSTQALVGGRWNIADGWRLQTEAWGKDFKRTELIGTGLERNLTGEAYGLDFLLAKPISERLYGWAALSLSDGDISDPSSGLNVTNQFTPPVSATIAASYELNNGWKVGAKYRVQSGDAYTPLTSVDLDPETGNPQPIFGEPFSERLETYQRLDVRVEKAVRHNFGDVLYYVDVLNVTDQENVSNRSFPLRNTTFLPSGSIQENAQSATISPNDEEGIPLFVAVGVNFSF